MVLDTLLEDMLTLSKLCKWAGEKYEEVDFHLRQCTDGDILQIFHTIRESGFFQNNWTNQEGAGTIEVDSDTREGQNPGSKKDPNEDLENSELKSS